MEVTMNRAGFGSSLGTLMRCLVVLCSGAGALGAQIPQKTTHHMTCNQLSQSAPVPATLECDRLGTTFFNDGTFQAVSTMAKASSVQPSNH